MLNPLFGVRPVGTDLPSQAEAEAGTKNTPHVWSAKRVKQSIDALAGGKHAIPIGVSQMTPTVSNGCSALTLVETTSGRPDLVVRDFSTSADELCQFGFLAPTSWNEGTVTFRAIWTHAGGQTGGLDGVAWFLHGLAVTDDDTADQIFGTSITVTDDQATAEDIYITDESAAVTLAATPISGDYLLFRVGRSVANGADDLDIDARLIGITLFFTTDAGNDA